MIMDIGGVIIDSLFSSGLWIQLFILLKGTFNIGNLRLKYFNISFSQMQLPTLHLMKILQRRKYAMKKISTTNLRMRKKRTDRTLSLQPRSNMMKKISKMFRKIHMKKRHPCTKTFHRAQIHKSILLNMTSECFLVKYVLNMYVQY